MFLLAISTQMMYDRKLEAVASPEPWEIPELSRESSGTSTFKYLRKSALGLNYCSVQLLLNKQTILRDSLGLGTLGWDRGNRKAGESVATLVRCPKSRLELCRENFKYFHPVRDALVSQTEAKTLFYGWSFQAFLSKCILFSFLIYC